MGIMVVSVPIYWVSYLYAFPTSFRTSAQALDPARNPLVPKNSPDEVNSHMRTFLFDIADRKLS